jgi:hypothetical protein
MDPDTVEREQIAWVFGLTGGELSDSPFVTADERTFAYWYDGAPEYDDHDYEDLGFETLMTVIASELYSREPDRLVEKDGSVWRRLASFTSSGETECPGQQDDEPTVTDAHCNGGDRCVLCDEAKGEEHGFIYLGDGWVEIIYGLVTDDE